MAAAQRVFLDRTTGTKYALTVASGLWNWTDTANASETEPIVEDRTNSSDHWTIFIDDGILGVESTATVQDDDIELEDEDNTGTLWRLLVDDGQFGIESFTAAAGSLVPILRRRRR